MKLTTLFLAFGLLSPLSEAKIVDDINAIEDILTNMCGPRTDVIWVDESHQNPPCTMSYSPYCTEIQVISAQSCMVIMNDSNPQPADDTRTVSLQMQND